jgi:hypothetical protein
VTGVYGEQGPLQPRHLAFIAILLAASISCGNGYGFRRLYQLPYFGFNPVALGDGLSVDAPVIVRPPEAIQGSILSTYGYGGALTQTPSFGYGQRYGTSSYGDPFSYGSGSYRTSHGSYAAGYGYGAHSTKLGTGYASYGARTIANGYGV